MQGTNYGKWGIEYWSDFGGINFWIPWPNSGAGNNYLFLQDGTGNIGIGTPTPEYKLHVVGDVFASGIFTSSDKRLKKNIVNVGHLQYKKLYQLVGKSYDKIEARGPVPNYANIQDSLKKATVKMQSENNVEKSSFEYGFLAQDFQSLFPELVKGDTSNSFLSINYTALIPLIIEALKDQQIQIDSLKQALTKCCENKGNKGNTVLGKKSEQNSDNSDQNSLSQNIPNPFTGMTSVSVNIANTFKSASLRVYNLNGEEIKVYHITSSGNSKININCSELNAGIYLYSLVVDNNEIDTKRMILTK